MLDQRRTLLWPKRRRSPSRRSQRRARRSARMANRAQALRQTKSCSSPTCRRNAPRKCCASFSNRIFTSKKSIKMYFKVCRTPRHSPSPKPYGHCFCGVWQWEWCDPREEGAEQLQDHADQCNARRIREEIEEKRILWRNDLLQRFSFI